MGNILQEMLADDGKEIVEDLGGVVTWKGDEYAAMIADPDISFGMQEGGLVASGDFVVKILRALFTGAIPKEGDVVTYDGKRYFVTGAPNKPESAFVRLDIATNP